MKEKAFELMKIMSVQEVYDLLDHKIKKGTLEAMKKRGKVTKSVWKKRKDLTKTEDIIKADNNY